MKIRKNQIIISTLALLMATAGYINYSKDIKKAQTDTNKIEDVINPGDAILTNGLIVSNKLSKLKLSRKQLRDENIANLNEIINNTSLDSEAKKSAVETYAKLMDKIELENDIEAEIEAKGYDGVYVCFSNDSIDICINSIEIDDVTRAQIEDIVTRRTGLSIDNVVITPLANQIAE